MPEVTLEGRPLKIFPVRGRKPACTHGFKDATADPAGIAALFDNARGAQIAVATGEVNDLDILDVDPRRGGHKFLEENRHRIPQTRTHCTPSGGWHLLFRHAPGLRGSYDRIAPGIEVKSTGGLVGGGPPNSIQCRMPRSQSGQHGCWSWHASQSRRHSGKQGMAHTSLVRQRTAG
jgi:hypothetical protein